MRIGLSGMVILLSVIFLCACSSDSEPPTSKSPPQGFEISSDEYIEEGYYVIRYPTGWKVEGTPTDGNILFMNADDTEKNNIPSSLGIVTDPSWNTGVEDIEDMYIKLDESMAYMYEDYNNMGHYSTSVDGFEAIVWEYEGKISPEDVFSPDEQSLAVVSGEQSMRMKSAAVFSDEYYWIFYVAAEEVYDEQYFDWFVANLIFRQ